MGKKNFRIAFFGSSLVSAYWNGAATYYRGIIKALHLLGHRTTFYEPDAYNRQEHRDIPEPEYARSVVYPANDESGVCRALEDARGADIIVKASGVGVFDTFLERAALDLRKPDSRVIFWDVDAPATLDRVREHPDDPFHALIPQYDFILTYGGGEPVMQAYRELGARNCIPIYNALDPETHHPVPPDSRFEGHLGFLGNRMPDREERVWDFFFRPAGMLPDRRFLLGGNGWNSNVPDLRNVSCLGHVYTRDHNAFNCTPAAVLNINRTSMVRYGYSPPTRIFEAAGAGACIITDAWEGIGMFLEPDRECIVAGSGEEVAWRLRDLTPERAGEIGGNALKRVLGEHTYSHRAAQVESILLNAGKAGMV
ncbi:MAG: CgeB family protein [Candidatus Latescibacterota bacterium]